MLEVSLTPRSEAAVFFTPSYVRAVINANKIPVRMLVMKLCELQCSTATDVDDLLRTDFNCEICSKRVNVRLPNDPFWFVNKVVRIRPCDISILEKKVM